MKLIENSVSNLYELLDYSNKGGIVGVVYSKDCLIGGWDTCVCSKDIDSEEDFKKVVLKDGYYYNKEDVSIYARRGTLVEFKEICDDFCGIIGCVVIGTFEGEDVCISACVLEDGDNTPDDGVIAEKVYLL